MADHSNPVYVAKGSSYHQVESRQNVEARSLFVMDLVLLKKYLARFWLTGCLRVDQSLEVPLEFVSQMHQLSIHQRKYLHMRAEYVAMMYM